MEICLLSTCSCLMSKILQVCVCPWSGQADLFSLFGVASMNLFLGADDRTNRTLPTINWNEAGKVTA